MKKVVLWVSFLVFVVLAAQAYNMSEMTIALVMGGIAALFGAALASDRVTGSL